MRGWRDGNRILSLTMLHLAPLAGDVGRALKDHLRPLLAYHLFFTILASAVLLPAVAWTLAHLLAGFGRPLIDGADLVEVLLSPGGVLWLLAAIGLTFLILFLQQAGMILVAVRPRDNHYRLAAESLWSVTRRLPGLVGLTTLQVGTHLLLVLPVALAISWLHGIFLGGLDPYYVQRIRPPALWQFLGAGLPLLLLWLWFAVGLYLRWLLALPALMLEGLSPLEALARSQHLTRGRGRPIAFAVIALLLVILALPILTTWLFGLVGTPLLSLLPERHGVLIPAMFAYLGSYVLLTLAITFFGIAANSLLTACLYLRLAHRHPERMAPPANAHPGRLAWGVEIAVLALALGQALLILNSFELRDRVTITAHRGSSLVAPENTLAAIERAIDDGADLIEIDARLTRDERVVVFHDRSLQRLAGDPRLLSELSLAELAGVDVGSWFGDAYVGEGIPSLAQALERTRGRGALMIELKPDPGREAALVKAVLETLEDEGNARQACHNRQMPAACGTPKVLEEVRLASLSPAMIREIEARAPQARTTLLAQFVLPGTLDRSSFDALGLRHNRIDASEIELARRLGYELYAWTVNDPARMSQLIDMGVDSIITDRPEVLAGLLAERRALSDGELLLLKLRNWLRA